MLNNVAPSVVALLAVAATANAYSPNNDYAPGYVTCPDETLVREADSLSSSETEWLAKRDAITQPILKEWLLNHVSDSATKSLISDIFGESTTRKPRIAISASGGGYRAMLSGAGMISALDDRTVGATESGLGGILQSATYLAGLSGGNWLTGSLAFNDWISVQEIIDQTLEGNVDAMWNIDYSIIDPEGLLHPIKDTERWETIEAAVKTKSAAGFRTSVTDLWGRALAYDWFPSFYNGGEALTWSTLKDTEVFANAEMPFVISVTDGRYPGTTVVNLNSTVFEVNPFEMGSWDASLNAFANVQYLGTEMSNGSPTGSQCVEGFDNTGFIMGTSSSLFNAFLFDLGEADLPSYINTLVKDLLTSWDETQTDIALYSPNPFYKTNYFDSSISTGSISNSETLYLGDGGEDGENIPLVPVIQEKREVDVVFALDNSNDTEDHWPAGLAVIATYERQFGELGGDIAFPTIPDSETFISKGLNKKPVFFGCDGSAMENLHYTPPVIIYVPNSEYSFESNESTFKLSYSQEERLGMIQNGYEVMTRNNLTDDSTFATCISCAIIKRSQERLGASISSECQQCYTDYCYN